mmetsp:Transcript_104966/g.208671  ORF Transcript_104966/g.208671 Transcript_104966/m.208671 type:complete len:262 (+) Transcript_104966:712-1497(+)
MTLLCTRWRPPCNSSVSASASAWAKFVNPRCHFNAAMLFCTRCLSSVRLCTAIAGLMAVVPSGNEVRRPLPKRPMAMRAADWPSYLVAYVPLSSAAKLRRVSKPSLPREPLPSSSITKSCCVAQSSSPTQSCVLQCCSCRRSPASGFGHLPRPRIGTSTGRERDDIPPPHAAEQGLQLFQSSSWQSWSQEPVLQGRASCIASQPRPPLRGFIKTDRVFTWTPPPQSLEHFDQPDQALTTQFTGHRFWLHLLCRSIVGHCMP